MRTSRRWLTLITIAVAMMTIPAAPVLAHESPEGSEWVMADWMFMSFALFAMVALTVFFAARRRGLLSNLEDAKYPMLEIDEPDYYTPDWARDQPDDEEVNQ